LLDRAAFLPKPFSPRDLEAEAGSGSRRASDRAPDRLTY
jgi:hypothetical protein